MIEVKNVTKKYGKFVAVDDISFTINDGEIVGLLGPNGAGKSTTMNMLTGFIEQTEGDIIVDGYNMLKKPKKAKREIGYMPEGVPLYSDLTVKEFITYMAEIKNVNKKERKEKIEKIIENTGLKDVQNKLTKNLLGKTHTVILSSHILSEVSQICNKVIIINKGKIVAVDTPENLENKVSNNNATYVTVEDTENKMDSMKDKIKEIKAIKLIKENEDGTKDYELQAEKDVDLRKIIFKEFAKENITIFEMKKADTTLEDAFMKLIEGGNK